MSGLLVGTNLQSYPGFGDEEPKRREQRHWANITELVSVSDSKVPTPTCYAPGAW